MAYRISEEIMKDVNEILEKISKDDIKFDHVTGLELALHTYDRSNVSRCLLDMYRILYTTQKELLNSAGIEKDNNDIIQRVKNPEPYLFQLEQKIETQIDKLEKVIFERISSIENKSFELENKFREIWDYANTIQETVRENKQWSEKRLVHIGDILRKEFETKFKEQSDRIKQLGINHENFRVVFHNFNSGIDKLISNRIDIALSFYSKFNKQDENKSIMNEIKKLTEKIELLFPSKDIQELENLLTVLKKKENIEKQYDNDTQPFSSNVPFPRDIDMSKSFPFMKPTDNPLNDSIKCKLTDCEINTNGFCGSTNRVPCDKIPHQFSNGET